MKKILIPLAASCFVSIAISFIFAHGAKIPLP
jgi:hypothetical protein